MKNSTKALPNYFSLAAVGLLSTLSFTQAANAAEISTPKAVIELFTSQGCYSCPPADKVLKKLVKNKDYLGLSFHVDYWDYIGWKDTFSQPDFTKRQRNYAATMQERQVYTPQAIINGRTHAVGSHATKIKNFATNFHESGKGLTVPIKVQETNGRFKVTIDPQDEFEDATLYAVYFEPSATVKIERGENGGKTLEYTNIVKKIEMLGMTGDNGLNTEFSLQDIKSKGFDNYALILQSKNTSNLPSAIIGASLVSGL
ncbi:MAG: DUF1223 domain-containing protein [Nitratireductor sp.]